MGLIGYNIYGGGSFRLKESHIKGGIITIDPMRWQMISAPIKYGYWDKTLHKHIHNTEIIAKIKNYIIDQIEDVYNTDASTMIEVSNTYIGHINKFYNYVVGVTQDTSEHNFQLAYTDTDNIEYVGMWVKSSSPQEFTIQWGDV